MSKGLTINSSHALPHSSAGQNGTLYSVNVVTSDLFYNSQLYNADLKTVDLTPPVFVNIAQ